MEGIRNSPPKVEQTTDEYSESFTLLEFKEALEANKVEENFRLEPLKENEAQRVRAEYEAIIKDPENFLGSGNYAVVYSSPERPGMCVKCQWELLLVNNKNKNPAHFPETARKLYATQKYFSEIRKKRSELTKKGYEFETQNSALQEAVLTKTAELALRSEGITGGVPDVVHVIRMEHSESGTFGKGNPYAVDEAMHMIRMKELPGVTLEQLILEHPEHSWVVDIENIRAYLERIVRVLHEHGTYHNDISLRNIMMNPDTGDVWLIDFGAAHYSSVPSDQSLEKNLGQLRTVMSRLLRYKDDPKKTAVELQKRFGD